MPDIINSIFGRPRTDAPEFGEHAEATTQTDNANETVEPTSEVAETDPTEDAENTDDTVESDEDQADESDADEDTDTDEDEDEDDTEAADEDGEIAEDVEPGAAEVVADDVDQAEPVAEPAAAETRPAAGTRGSTTVGDGVVAKIVNLVARKTDGVHDLDDGGTSVENDDDVATITVSLVVEYGHPIKALAERIRTDVIEAVEQFLSLDVAAVDIHVSDIHQPAAT